MSTAHNTHAGLVVLVSCMSIVGCVQQHGAPDLQGALAVSDDKGAVIVGSVNWQESVTLPEGSAERVNAMAVAYLSIPAEGTRCTGFLIAPNVIMTNQHCIPRASSANGVRAYFHREQGSTVNDAGIACSTFLGNDASLDFALLQCEGAPGDTYGVLELQSASLAQNAQVYVIHQNCDYYSSPSCDPTKKYSPGKITSTGSEFGHDADTLGGSSGSPMFSRTSHAVVGLHHVGLSNNGNGRGTGNRAVRMTNILNAIAQRYPGIALGARTPAQTDEPSQQGGGADGTTTGDLYEPNDAFGGAVQVQVPFSSHGARIDASDVDHFAFAGGGTRTLTMTFSHAAGDLDVYVYDAAGVEVAKSIGTTDTESVSRAFGDGMFTVRVLGYQGATGGYALTVE